MVSAPVPKPPTTTVPVFVQLEPASVTVTVPSPPARLPINPATSVTVPLFWMASVPVPEPPITRFALFVQLALAPDTATVPCEPDGLPTSPVVVLSSPSPPAPMVTVPLPPAVKPRVRLLADAGPVTCAVPPLSMIASFAGPGAPDGAQLAPVAQLPVASTQVFTCACAGAETAVTSAIVASNLDKTNLRPARAHDLALRARSCVRQSTPCASHIGPRSIGNAKIKN